MTRIKNEREEKLLKMMEQGIPVPEIADALKLSKGTVYKYAKRKNLSYSNFRKNTYEAIKRLADMDLTKQEIARELEVSIKFVDAGFREKELLPKYIKIQNQIVKLAKDGHTRKEIAEIAGVHPTTVSNTLRKNKIPVFTELEKKQRNVKELLDKGVPPAEVQKQLGVSYTMVKNWATGKAKPKPVINLSPDDKPRTGKSISR